MGGNHDADEPTIDARGLACPLPVLKLRKTLQRATPGTIWVLLATDPAAMRDVRAFCAAAGHEVIEQTRDGDMTRFRVRVGDRDAR
jgi:tRNA 2-thiouridine synthesizing protein A